MRTAFISRGCSVISGNYAADLLGQRLEAVRARLFKLNERLPEDATPWGWTLEGDELAEVKERYPQLSNRRVVTVVTQDGLRELAKHTRTLEAVAIRKHPANHPMLVFQHMQRRTKTAGDMVMIAEIEELRRMKVNKTQQDKANSARQLDNLVKDELMPPGFATIEALAQHDPHFYDVSEAQNIADHYHVEMCTAHVIEDGKLMPVDAYNIAEYRRVSARKAHEFGLM